MQELELRQLPLLSELTDEQLERVRGTSRQVELDAGETLFHMGEPSGNFFFLNEGAIKLFRVSPTGQEKILEIIRRGQTFAEAVMFFPRPVYPVSAEALTPARITAFDSRNFMSMLHDSPETCIQLLGTLSIRLHHRVNEIDALSLQNSTLRVASFLLHRLPDEAEDGTTIELEAAKRIIAARLSIQPETFSRVLHALHNAGAIEVSSRSVTVNDVDRLQAICLGERID